MQVGILKLASYASILALCLGFFSGCASYEKGVGGTLPFKKVYIAPVENNAFIPQASTLLSQNLRQAFMRDTRIQLVDKGDADVMLEVVLEQYDREVDASQSADTRRARSYDLELLALCTLRHVETGSLYMDKRPLAVDVHALSDSGLQIAEYQDTSILVRKLSERIQDAVLSTW